MVFHELNLDLFAIPNALNNFLSILFFNCNCHFLKFYWHQQEFSTLIPVAIYSPHSYLFFHHSLLREMEIPVIDFSKLAGEERSKTMKLLHHACEKWGFFMVINIKTIVPFAHLSCSFLAVFFILVSNSRSFIIPSIYAGRESWNWQRVDGECEGDGDTTLWTQLEDKLLCLRCCQVSGEEREYQRCRLGKHLLHLASSYFQHQWTEKPPKELQVSSSLLFHWMQ